MDLQQLKVKCAYEKIIPPLFSPMDERCRKIKCQTLIKIGMMNIEGAIHAGVTCCWTEQAIANKSPGQGLLSFLMQTTMS